jgi:hypothetical protein
LIVTDAVPPRLTDLVCAVTLTASAFGSAVGFPGVGREVASSTWDVGAGLFRAAALGAALPALDPHAVTATAIAISGGAKTSRRTPARG